jgi:hypothetical protein
MTAPDCGDEWDTYSDYEGGWHAIHVEVTAPNAIGTLYVVTDHGEQPYTLLDRPPITFGFCP